MTYKHQCDYVLGVLDGRGFKVETEVNLGVGLWCGIRADAVMHGWTEYPLGLGIELKWQDSSGSAHYKIPHAVLTIQRHYPIPGVLVVSGGHRGIMDALGWAKGEVGTGLLVGAFTTDEFYSWCPRKGTP